MKDMMKDIWMVLGPLIIFFVFTFMYETCKERERNERESELFEVYHSDEQVALIIESAKEIKVGSKAILPDYGWVDVINQGENIPYDSCVVCQGRIISVLEIQGKDLVVAYEMPVQTHGTMCPDGTQFIVSKADFATMTEKYLQNIEQANP
ncbi:hypothetical protein C4569_02860 [Candidatus Parcubacteria bacterium]|nr:MAG: hypothetical protein C4569_02860 [Candidatus Parcubacteria bacterium]